MNMDFVLNVKIIQNKLSQSALFKDSFWAVLGNLLGKGLSLLSGVIIARLLGKEVYGEFGILKNTISYLVIFSTFGFGYTVTRYISKYIVLNKHYVKSIVNLALKMTLATSFVLALFAFVFNDHIAIFLEAPNLSGSIRLLSLVIVFNGINNVQIGILAGFKQFKIIAFNNLISGLVCFLLSIILIFRFHLNGAVFALLVSFIVQFLLNRHFVNKILLGYEDISSVPSIFKSEMIFFSLPIALQDGLYSIIHWTVSFLLIKYSNYGELGIYSATTQWASIVLFVPSILNNVVLSHLSTGENNKGIMNKMISFNFIFSVICFIIIWIFSNQICLMYGSSFFGLKNVLIYSTLASVFNSVSNVYISQLISNAKTWLVFMSKVLRDLLLIAVFYFCVINISEGQALLLSKISLLSAFIYLLVLFLLNFKNGEFK